MHKAFYGTYNEIFPTSANSVYQALILLRGERLGDKASANSVNQALFFLPQPQDPGNEVLNPLGHSKLIFSFWSYPSFLHDAGGRAIKSIGLRNLHH